MPLESLKIPRTEDIGKPRNARRTTGTWTHYQPYGFAGMPETNTETDRSKNPSSLDLQVNGYGGIDFNQDDLHADDLRTAIAALTRDGVGGILATIITEDLAVMCRRIARLVALREQDEAARRMIVGLHIEGPFINPADGFRGAHPRDAVRPADVAAMTRLLDAAGGMVRYVTLAPECDARFAVTRMLANQGIAVAAGHTDASLDQLHGAIDVGLRLFTHLGNGCPGNLPRHDNIVQRA
ncbi:MAG: amidohydrolase family protein [Pirellulales bacterium]